jgi:putative DNA primase/helicase
MNPGCKVDTMLVLTSGQGAIKSTFFSVLGGPWYSNTPFDLQDKDRFAAVHGAWILEVAEFDDMMRGRDASRLKAFVSSAIDCYRAPYAREVESRPRSSVFAATTNEDRFLEDTTGSRRFWVIRIRHAIDAEMLAHARDQLWAEALVAYESGEQWWLTHEQDSRRAALNTEFEPDDPWTIPTIEWLRVTTKTAFSMADALEHGAGLEVGQMDRSAAIRMGRVLKRLGWIRFRQGTNDSSDGSRPYLYSKPNGTELIDGTRNE